MARSHKQSIILTSLLIAVIAIGLGFIAMRRVTVKEPGGIPVKSMSSWQRADDPLGLPSPKDQTSPFDTRFIQLTAFERAAIPTAIKTHHPMGSINGALTYNAQAFWDLNQRRGGHHTGDDLNGIGGMNSDLGDPVFATCNGLVIYRGEPSRGWGNTLLLAHKDSKGDIYNTMYSHLDKSYLPFAKLIPQGNTVGTVGTANGNYPAHLHLELRSSAGVYIGGGYRAHPGECLPAEKSVNYEDIATTNFVYKTPLSIILENKLKTHRETLMKIKY